MVKFHTGTSLLGHSVERPQSPDEATLERVPNPHEGQNYIARFTAPEFTSLCPVTGQPDFALHRDRLSAGRLARRIEIAQALSDVISQSWRIP